MAILKYYYYFLFILQYKIDVGIQFERDSIYLFTNNIKRFDAAFWDQYRFLIDAKQIVPYLYTINTTNI